MARKLSRLLIGAVVGSVGLLASACGASAAASAPTTANSTVSMALPVGFSLNWWPPLVPSYACSDIVGGGGFNGPDTYWPLVWVGRSDNVNLSRSIASSIVPSNNDTTFTITLNPKWHWTNGSPVTAADVVYDWNLIKAASAPNSPMPYCFSGSGGVPGDWGTATATGKDTVVVTTTKSVNPVWFEHNGLSQIVPLPKQLWDRYSNMTQELNWIKSISTKALNPIYQVVDGPYVIKKAVTNSYWEFKANPHYDGLHKPAIKTLILRYETSSAAEFAQLRTGKVDVGPLSYSLYSESKQLTGYHLVAEKGFEFDELPINFRSDALGVGGLFNNLYIRQALQMGINQPGMISALYHGLAVPTYGPVPATPRTPYYDPALKSPYTYNLAKGKALLEQHGWKMKNGVMTNASGQQLAFTFIYPTGSPTYDSVAQLLAEDWGQEGIKVTLDAVGSSDYSAIVEDPSGGSKWALAGDMAWGYGPDFYPSGGGLFASGAGFNMGDYNSPTMNTLIAKTYEGGTPAQVSARFFAYEAYADQNLPVLWMPTPENLMEVSNQIHNYRKAYDLVTNYSLINWWTLGS